MEDEKMTINGNYDKKPVQQPTGRNYDVRRADGTIDYSKQHKMDMELFNQIDKAGNGDGHISRNEYYEYLNKQLSEEEAKYNKWNAEHAELGIDHRFSMDKAERIQEEMKKFDEYATGKQLNIDEFMQMRDDERTDEITSTSSDGKVKLSLYSSKDKIEQYVARFDEDKDGRLDLDESKKFKEVTDYSGDESKLDLYFDGNDKIEDIAKAIEEIRADDDKRSERIYENEEYRAAVDLAGNNKGLNRSQFLNYVEQQNKVAWDAASLGNINPDDSADEYKAWAKQMQQKYGEETATAKKVLNSSRWSDGKTFTEAEDLERYLDEEFKFKQLDKNGDGYISQEEYEKRPEK